MKKFLAYLLVAVLVLSCLSGCKKNKGGDTPDEGNKVVVDDSNKNDDSNKTDVVETQDDNKNDAADTKEDDAADTKDDTTDDTQAPDDTDEGDDEDDEDDEDDGIDLESARQFIFNMYKDKQGTVTADFERVAVLNIGDILYNITWSVDNAKAANIVAGEKAATIDIDEKTPEVLNFVLTATISAPNGETITQSFTHDIPAYKEANWFDYYAAAAGDPVVCKGVVTGIMSKTNGNSSNCLYFQDNDGGYYAYNLGSDPVTDGIKVGMTIKVSGKKDVYSGTLEIKDCNVEIIDKTIKTVKPVDYTDKYIKADGLKDAKLTERQALLVTLKNVEIGGVGDNGYYYFILNGVQSYVRISSSVCPIVAEKDKFIDGFTAHQGWIANATGVLCVYDGAFYLTPITTDAYEYISLPKKSDAEMVEIEAEKIKFAGSYNTATTIAAPAEGTTYSDVKIAWTTSDPEVAAIADGALNIVLPKMDTEVTVTATFTAGKETKTVEYTFKVEAPADDMCQAEILAKAFALEDGAAMNGKQVLRGEIVEIPTAYDEKYGNVTVNIKVGEQIIQCFRLIGGSELKVGDVITVTGIIKNYKGTVEFDAKCTYDKDLTEDQAKALVVVEKAFALEEGASMSGKQVLAGEIVEIPTAYDEKYGNVTVNIKVGEQIIQCFRLTGGSDLKVGDKITVTGTLKNYKGTVEFDAKCTYIMGEDYAAAKQAITVAKAFELEEGAAMSGLQVLTGEIVEIPTAYDEKYGNVTVNIKVGEQVIQCFRLIGGSELKVGDVITVTGNIKNYKGTVEFDAKCTYVK